MRNGVNRRVELSYLKQHISQDRRECGIGMDLQLKQKELAEMQPAQRVGVFAALVREYGLVLSSTSLALTVDGSSEYVGPEGSAWRAELALRMASDPGTVPAWAGEHIGAGIKGLLAAPTLARAARFCVLAVAQQKESLASANEVYAGWRWSR